MHLPSECTISIYTLSGKLVDKIEHSSTIADGQEKWDLVSMDGMDIAFGVYVFMLMHQALEKNWKVCGDKMKRLVISKLINENPMFSFTEFKIVLLVVILSVFTQLTYSQNVSKTGTTAASF